MKTILLCCATLVLTFPEVKPKLRTRAEATFAGPKMKIAAPVAVSLAIPQLPPSISLSRTSMMGTVMQLIQIGTNQVWTNGTPKLYDIYSIDPVSTNFGIEYSTDMVHWITVRQAGDTNVHSTNIIGFGLPGAKGFFRAILP